MSYTIHVHIHVLLTLIGPDGTLSQHWMVIYKFDGVLDHKVFVRSHGTAKWSKGKYQHTMESIKKELRSKLGRGKPKKVVDELYREKGGILKAQSAGELPRD